MAELNPQIALQGLLINRNDENLKQQRYQQGQQAAADKRRLADLLPQAMGYGTQGITQADITRDGPLPTSYETADQGWRAAYDEARQNDPSIHSFDEFLQIQQRYRANPQPEMAGARQQDALRQIAAINPELYLKLDANQRKAVHDQLDDMGSAVRWAVSDPTQRAQRWNQVVDFYSRQHPQIAQYRDHPEMAEQALMQLGQMGEYLKAADKNNGTALQQNYEFFAQKDPKLADQYLHNQAEGSPMIASNGDGTFTIIPRGYGTAPAPQQGGGMPRVNSPDDAAKLPPGTQFIMPDGRIGTVPGGAGGNASGGFPGGY